MYRTQAKLDTSKALTAKGLRPTAQNKRIVKQKKKARKFMNGVILHRELERKRKKVEEWDVEAFWRERVEPILIKNYEDGKYQVEIQSQLECLEVNKLFTYARSLGYFITLMFRNKNTVHYMIDTRGPSMFTKIRHAHPGIKGIMFAGIITIIFIMLTSITGCTNTPNVQVQGVEVAHTEQVKKQHQGDAKAMIIIGSAIAAGGVLSLPVLEDRGDGALAYPIIMGGAGAALILSGVIYYLAEE